MSRHRICDVRDLKEGERLLREVAGREVAVFLVNGEFHAVANYCVHAGGPVCEGKISGMVTADPDKWEWDWDKDGEVLACPWHGWEFDLTTGEFLSDPRYSLITYDIDVEEDSVYVVTGTSETSSTAEAAETSDE